MKKSLQIIVFSFVLFSCGSRHKTVDKNESKTISDTSVNITSEASVKFGRKESNLEIYDLSKSKISIIPKTSKCADPQNNSDISKARIMTIKDSKGNEANIPVDENSEINIENTSDQVSRIKTMELELAEIKKEKINLQATNEELKKDLKSSLESNKPMWWLYVLLFVSGVSLIPFLKLIAKR
ncbi:hypothetical protein ACNFU2_06455 [Chryseobacterium sp. PTM-20240506]|uniref:hypothetical protein n=1 Tax=Chryseobacterium sp. PTM-20240506 TaxID=3400631 RepID=UPI003AAFA1B1